MRSGVLAATRRGGVVHAAGVREARTPTGFWRGCCTPGIGVPLSIEMDIWLSSVSMGRKVHQSGRSGAWHKAAGTSPVVREPMRLREGGGRGGEVVGALAMSHIVEVASRFDHDAEPPEFLWRESEPRSLGSAG